MSNHNLFERQVAPRQRMSLALGALLMVATVSVTGCDGVEDVVVSSDTLELDGGLAEPGLTESHARVPSPGLSQEGVVLFENVQWLDAETVRRATVTPTAITITSPLGPALLEYSVGDVLLTDYQEGFWRKITSIDIDAQGIVFQTRDARIEEVVRDGEFVFDSDLASDDDDLRSQSQALLPLSGEEVRAVAVTLDRDFSSEQRFRGGNVPDLHISGVSGGLEFTPVVRMRIRIENGRIAYESLQASGTANLSASWQIDVASQSSFQRSFSASPQTGSASFQLLGRQFLVTPEIRFRYEVSGSQSGRIVTGYVGDGYVFAGYECSVAQGCRALQSSIQAAPFAAAQHVNVIQGQPTITMRTHIEAGVALREGIVEAASLTPLGMLFHASTTVSPPYCPRETSGAMRSTSTRREHEFVSSNTSLFEDSSVIPNVDGCSVGRPEQGIHCIDDSACPDGHVCAFPANECVLDGDLRVTLSWLRGETDLDLYIQTPSNEVLSLSNRFVTGGELTRVSAGAVACDDCTSECRGNASLNCQEQTPSAAQCPPTCSHVPGTATCSGTYSGDCYTYSQTNNVCLPGCNRFRWLGIDICYGTYSNTCSSFGQSACQSHSGCSWSQSPARCDGGIATCSDLGQHNCDNLPGCQWYEAPLILPPYVENAIFPRLIVGELYRIWVVNSSGSSTSEPLPYVLQFDARDRETFELRGQVEPYENARSVFFDYRVPPPDGHNQDGGCLSDFDSVICAERNKECGPLGQTITDNCGVTRNDVHCGGCPTLSCNRLAPIGQSCPFSCTYSNGACTGGLIEIPCSNNSCDCGDDSDADLCAMYQKECGTLAVADTCGSRRTINCGACPNGVQCSDLNVCCQPETDAQLCETRNVMGPVLDSEGNPTGQQEIINFACGEFFTVDSCGNQRTVNCSSSNCSSLNGIVRVLGPYEACSGNTLQLRDRYENREYSCGDEVLCEYQCPTPNGVVDCQNDDSEDAPHLIERVLNPNIKNCRVDSFYRYLDQAGHQQSVNIANVNDSHWGQCEFSTPCTNTGIQYRSFFEYVCSSESDSYAGACGSLPEQIQSRTCTRNSDGLNCGAQNQLCYQEECCTQDSNAALCSANNKSCGSLSTTDNCNRPRNINSCGVCPSGTSCEAGVCEQVCPQGQVSCDGTCIDPNTNPAYCGASGNCEGNNRGEFCGSGRMCVMGNCQLCPMNENNVRICPQIQ